MKFVMYVDDAGSATAPSVKLFVALTCRPSRKVALLLFISQLFFAMLFDSFFLVVSTFSSCTIHSMSNFVRCYLKRKLDNETKRM